MENKYDSLTIKQSSGGTKVDMSYDEYIRYLVDRPRGKKSLDQAYELAKDKFNKALYTKHKNELTELLIERYNIYAVPSFIYIKLGKIANGTFNGMNGRGISLYNILRYMKVKGKYLTKQSFRVKFKNGSDRLNYELSIVINDYPRFKKETLNKAKYDPIEFGKVALVSKTKKKDKVDKIVVNDILKDMFSRED